MVRSAAGWLAGRGAFPTSLRAVLGYYADSGVFDYGSLKLKRRVDDTTGRMIEAAFEAVEVAIADAFDRESVDFEYDTKLVMPAELTLGYLYRREADDAEAEAMTQLVVEALIDGDMRDAINDDEFEDFAVDFPLEGPEDRRRVAEVAQAALEERVEEAFAEYPDSVREAYDWAVEVSEAHQDEDDAFRDMLQAAQVATDSGGTAADTPAPEEAREQIRSQYKFADFEDPPDVFEADELDLPYLKTQYDRVGVIYDGMIEMYRAAGLEIEDAFKKSIVLAIIGAQIWLDDLDDYDADRHEGQLTPVTAEYVLNERDVAAATEVVAISERYLDLAKSHASAVDSPLTGIATEYIYRDGEPGILPGYAG